MHPASRGELGYYETGSNDCFSLFAYSRILSSKTAKKSNALIFRVKFYVVTFIIYLNTLEQNNIIFAKLFHGFSKHLALIR